MMVNPNLNPMPSPSDDDTVADSSSTSTRKNRPKRSELQEDFVKECPECGGHIVTDHDRGERHCELCGIIIDDSMIDQGLDYSVYEERHKSREHVGPPTNTMYHTKGLPTEIDPSMKDSYGRPITGRSRRDVFRLQYWSKKNQIMDSRERNIAYAFTEINAMCSRLELSSVVRDSSGYYYKKAVDENLIRGRSIVSVIAASIYMSCRVHDQPRSLDELVEVSNVSRKEIGRVYRFMAREFGIRLAPPQGSDFIERYCDRVGVPADVKRRARVIIEVCENNLTALAGKAPNGIIGASIWIAVEDIMDCDDAERRITQERIASICQITDVTIRNRCQDIRRLLDNEGEGV